MNKSTHKRKVRVFNLDLGLTSLRLAAYSHLCAAWQLNAGSPCLVWTLGSTSWPIANIPKWSVCSCGRNWRPEPKEHLRTSVRSTWTSTGPTGTTSCSCTATTSSKFGAAAWVESRGAKWPGGVWPGGRGVGGGGRRRSWAQVQLMRRRLCFAVFAGSRLSSTSSRRTPCTTRWVSADKLCWLVHNRPHCEFQTKCWVSGERFSEFFFVLSKNRHTKVCRFFRFWDKLRFCLEQIRLRLSYARKVVSAEFGLI